MLVYVKSLGERHTKWVLLDVRAVVFYLGAKSQSNPLYILE